VIPRRDLRCPVTGSELLPSGDGWLQSAEGSRRYPVVGGIPILIVDERSLFSIDDYQSRGETVAVEATGQRWKRLGALRNALPAASRNVAAKENLAALADLVQGEGRRSVPRRVLVVGGASAGEGMAEMIGRSGVVLVETDVYIGPRTEVVCDGHDLPFVDACFDAVICQAVLEHVLDPQRVVQEIRRVLRPGGFVYSEIPFMQQVHEGAYDFARFTHVGHRHLFRYFDEIRSGTTGGPGMALAWSCRYFAMSFVSRSRPARAAIDVAVSMLTFWLKHFDSLLARKPAGLDAASGTYFLGRLREAPVPDSEILRSYRGSCPAPVRR
jgi:SAM-dependent methyltransferase